MTHPRPAPTDPLGVLRQLGPGLIISAAIVGSGELIVTPKLGATVGFSLLWFIILGCIIKVFVQIELGRFALARGGSTLAAMDAIPGPRARVSWMVWLWALMFGATVLQVAGIVGGIAGILALAGVAVSKKLLALFVAASTAVLLVAGRYRLVERFSMAMVAVFTLCTVGAVVALQSTPLAITGAQVLEGLSFNLPSSFTVAFAAFGVIGVGASELIYYPYWCLEKGYASQVGPEDGSPGWLHRATGWMRILRIDAWVSCGVYTTATVAFYLLGAGVLHANAVDVSNTDMIAALSQMYRSTFGEWGLWLFLIGGFAVLYSTFFVATASNARLFADACALFHPARCGGAAERVRLVKAACVGLPLASAVVFMIWEAPVTLVFVGAVAQGLMLPFLAILALWLHHRRIQRVLLPGRVWRLFLWFAAACMVATGAYQVVNELGRLWR